MFLKTQSSVKTNELLCLPRDPRARTNPGFRCLRPQASHRRRDGSCRLLGRGGRSRRRQREPALPSTAWSTVVEVVRKITILSFKQTTWMFSKPCAIIEQVHKTDKRARFRGTRAGLNSRELLGSRHAFRTYDGKWLVRPGTREQAEAAARGGPNTEGARRDFSVIPNVTGFCARNSAPAENHQAVSEPSKSAAGTRELGSLHCEAKWGGGGRDHGGATCKHPGARPEKGAFRNPETEHPRNAGGRGFSIGNFRSQGGDELRGCGSRNSALNSG